MRYKVITTFKPGDWDRYARRMVQSVIDRWPNVDLTVYYEGQGPYFDHQRVTWVDIDKANPKLHKFREHYKNDPVAMGKLDEIPGGVRRSSRLETEGGMDAKKEARPSMINKIIEDMKSEIGDVEDMDEGMEMQQPQEETEAMPTEETQEEMPMEQPKGLMARRV